jgi:CRP-like cAMP-binding protein
MENEGFASLTALGEPIRRERGVHVFRQGDANRHAYLVIEGLLKAYYLTADGKESIKSFISEHDLVGSLTAVQRDGECSFSLVCLEPCHLIEIPVDGLFGATRRDPALAQVMIGFLLDLAMKKERREMEFLTLTAGERYDLLLERTPQLPARVAQKDIARYLGITPVALSRIRSRRHRT